MLTDQRFPAALAQLGFAALLTLSACDKDKDGDAKQGGGEAAAAAAAEPGEAGAAAAGADVKTFLKDQRKKGCEMLPPSLAAKQLEVPEGELQQMKIAGCNYSWTSADDSQTAEASITTIMVHDDADKARRWFDNATKSQTAEELRAQMGAVTKAAKGHEAIDSETKEQAVEQVGGLIGAMIPDGGHQYEDVAGVGDAARALQHDGSLTVMVGNMVFVVRAYKGAAAPAPDMAGLDMRDMDQVMAAAKQADAAWMEQTRDVRKAQAIELAKAIIAGL